MPSTWVEWGIDANGDGVADPWNPDDAVFSAARYLAAAGGATDLPRAVYAYNHADWYVNEVLGLADLYDQGASTTFALDRLQVDLDAAQSTVAAVSARLVSARAQLRKALRVEALWNRRANAETLLSARLADEQQAGLAAERASSAQALVARRTAALAAAQAQLAQARQAAAPVSFSVAAAPLLGAPDVLGRLRLPGRRRPGRRLGLAHPPRLPGRRHRRAGGLSALRPRRRRHPPLLDRPRPVLRHRPDDAGLRRADLDVLPPLVSRAGDRRRRLGDRRRAGRPRRLHRRRDRARTSTSSSSRRPSGRSRSSGSRASPARPSAGRTGPRWSRRPSPSRFASRPPSARPRRSSPRSSRSSRRPRLPRPRWCSSAAPALEFDALPADT